MWLFSLHEDRNWWNAVLFFLRRASFFACRLDKHLYVIGGRNESGYLSSVESYNLETNEWNYVSSLPQPLAAHAGAVHNGKIYISGENLPLQLFTILSSLQHVFKMICCIQYTVDSQTFHCCYINKYPYHYTTRCKILCVVQFQIFFMWEKYTETV